MLSREDVVKKLTKQKNKLLDKLEELEIILGDTSKQLSLKEFD